MPAATTPAVKKKSKTLSLIITGSVLGVVILVWGLVSKAKDKSAELARQNPSRQIEQTLRANSDMGIITATVDGVSLPIDPSANISVEPIDRNIAWEKVINGVAVKRFPVGKNPITLVNPESIGSRDSITYRVCAGQVAENMRLAYVKHYTPDPPFGWYEIAKKL